MTLDEKSFFSTIISFSPYWDYKSYNDDANFGGKIIKVLEM